MLYFGVKENSRLFKECQKYFYTFCRKQDYQIVEVQVLRRTLETYSDDLLKVFLTNFLNVMELKELRGFQIIGEYLRRKLSNLPEQRYQFFFENIIKNNIGKYSNWLNIINIQKYFNNDERSEF